MNKSDSLKLRSGDVIDVSHGYKRVERCTVMGPARAFGVRGALIPIKRHKDGAEYMVNSSRVIDVVSLKGMEP